MEIKWTINLEVLNDKVLLNGEDITTFIERPQFEELTQYGNCEIDYSAEVELEYHPGEKGDMYCPEDPEGFEIVDVFTGFGKLCDIYIKEKIFDEIPAMIKKIKDLS